MSEAIKRKQEIMDEYRQQLFDLLKDTYPEKAVVQFMTNSDSEDNWNDRCDVVKDRFGGYPSFWYPEIVLSGVMSRTSRKWMK